MRLWAPFPIPASSFPQTFALQFAAHSARDGVVPDVAAVMAVSFATSTAPLRSSAHRTAECGIILRDLACGGGVGMPLRARRSSLQSLDPLLLLLP